MFGPIWNFVNHLRDQAHVKRSEAIRLIKLKYMHHLNLLEYELPDKNAVLHLWDTPLTLEIDQGH